MSARASKVVSVTRWSRSMSASVRTWRPSRLTSARPRTATATSTSRSVKPARATRRRSGSVSTRLHRGAAARATSRRSATGTHLLRAHTAAAARVTIAARVVWMRALVSTLRAELDVPLAHARAAGEGLDRHRRVLAAPVREVYDQRVRVALGEELGEHDPLAHRAERGKHDVRERDRVREHGGPREWARIGHELRCVGVVVQHRHPVRLLVEVEVETHRCATERRLLVEQAGGRREACRARAERDRVAVAEPRNQERRGDPHDEEDDCELDQREATRCRDRARTSWRRAPRAGRAGEIGEARAGRGRRQMAELRAAYASRYPHTSPRRPPPRRPRTI